MSALNLNLHLPGKPARRSARGLLQGALLLCLLVGPAPALVGAASPWSNLSRLISPKAQAGQAGGADEARANRLVNAVPDENALTTASQTTATDMPVAPSSAAPGKPITGLRGLNYNPNQKQDAGKPKLGLESDEDETMLATNLFKNPEIRRFLGNEPRFIYDPGDRPDPMLVPWVRRAAIFKELAAQADTRLAAGDVEQAIEIYKKILELKDPRFTAMVQAKLAEIDMKQHAADEVAMQASIQAEERVELPSWVQDNTSGVIISPGKSLCLVGDFMLHVGDPLPNYPAVKVASIAEKCVVYQIKDKTFEVKLIEEQ